MNSVLAMVTTPDVPKPISTALLAILKAGGAYVPLDPAYPAERLAWAGLRVLLLTCDSQEDARHRLGVKATDPLVARRSYGSEGSVTVVGLRGSKAIDLLYRLGPDQLGVGSFDLAVVDTPPEVQGGSLLWQKERLLNLLLPRLPAHCRHVAWLD